MPFVHEIFWISRNFPVHVKIQKGSAWTLGGNFLQRSLALRD